MKKIIIPILIGLIVLILLLLGIKMMKHKNSNVIENQTVNGIEFINASLKYEEDLSTFSVIVNNVSDNDIYLNIVDIVFQDKNGNEIITLKGLVDRNLEPKKSAMITAQASMEIKDYKKIIYKF